MRIGFDMLAVQSPHHGHRGIGRYSRHLVSALMARDDGHRFILYAHDDLPTESIPTAPRAEVRRLGIEPEHGVGTVSQAVDRLARVNPDGLDVLMVLSPFERWANYLPPGPSPGGPRLAAVVYDMIPFLSPNEHVVDAVLMRFYRALERLRRYDALLAISESTRADTLSLLGLPGGRVVNVGAASDGLLFAPADGPPSEDERRTLRGLGVTRPYVLNVGGMDDRKNPWGLIDAFARLPEHLRRTHQLVLTFTILPQDADRLRQHAAALDVGDAVVVTGEVSDEALRTLYQRCEAFAFPSSYEGFGLPILEALQCGAAVVAGDNSSQREVVGDAGLLANVADPSDVAAKLALLLDGPGLAESLRGRAASQASRFSWGRTASRAAEALAALPRRRPSSWRRGPSRRGRGSPSSRPCRRASRASPTTPRCCWRSSGAPTPSTSTTTPATSPTWGWPPTSSPAAMPAISRASPRRRTTAPSSTRWATRAFTATSMRR